MSQAGSSLAPSSPKRKRRWGPGPDNFNFRHGLSSRSEYFIWHAMKRRCYDPGIGDAYKRYGARGIRVCDRWLASLEAFIEDMGPRPSLAHTLDRLDSNGHYEPGNCRWAITPEQSLNKRTTRMVVYQGQEMPLRVLCDSVGVNFHTVQCRLDRGWDIERALASPLKGSRWGPGGKPIK